MPKAEISWKRTTEEGVALQCYAQHVGKDWVFYRREKRFDQWAQTARPPLEDWMALLDAMTRLVNRRRYQPDDETLLRRQIRERFPEAGI